MSRTVLPVSRLAVILLVDQRGWVLLQERDEFTPRSANQWGMVGGHVEDGEGYEPAAYRELEEETGLRFEAGLLQLWRSQSFSYSDGFTNDYQVYVAASDITDADIVVGEGRQIVFVDPATVPSLDKSESCAFFVPEFLASDAYRSLVR